MKKADICAGIIGIFIGCWVIYTGRSFPADVVMKIGPSFFPDFLAGGLIIFSTTLLIRAVLGHSIGNVEHWHWSDPGVRRGAITLVFAIIFCIIIKPLGFLLTSILFLGLMMIVLDWSKPKAMLWLPITTAAAIAFINYLNYLIVIIKNLSYPNFPGLLTTAISTLAFLLGMACVIAPILLLSKTKWFKPLNNAWMTAAITVGIWLIFEKLLNLDLPQGVLSNVLG